MKNLFNHFIKDEEGATAVEYGLMVGLIGIVIIAALTGIGSSLTGTFTAVDTGIANR